MCPHCVRFWGGSEARAHREARIPIEIEYAREPLGRRRFEIRLRSVLHALQRDRDRRMPKLRWTVDGSVLSLTDGDGEAVCLSTDDIYRALIGPH